MNRLLVKLLIWLAKKRESRLLILQEAMRGAWNTVSADDILHRDSHGGWYFEGRPLSEAEVALLRAEAENFRSSKLYKVLKADMKYQLGKKMFEEARVPDDFLWGQLGTWLWDVIKTRLEKM